MNPLLKKLLAQTAAPAQENLVDDAIDANKTAGTTDPAQAQKNVDFQAEIDRLKNLQGDDGQSAADPTTTDDGADAGGDSGSTDPAAGADGDGFDAGADTGAADAGAGADASSGDPEAATSEDNKDGGSQEDADKDTDDGGDVNLPDETTDEAEPPVEEAEVAQEALQLAAEALAATARAHEHGVIKPHHVALFETALESQYTSLGVAARLGISAESDVPEGAASRLRYVAGRVKEFLKEVLAKMREYYGKVMAWIKQVFASYREYHGQFEKNTEGLLKRIAYLEGKERPKEEIEALAEKKTISLRALATGNDAPTMESVKEGIASLVAAGNGIYYSVTEESAFGPLIDLVTRVSEHDMLRVLVGDINAVTPERMFRISGSSAIFANPQIYKNTTRAASNYSGMDEFTINGLLGLSSYKWTLAKADANNIDELVHINNLYGFSVQTVRNDVQGSLLTSLDDCKKAMQLIQPLLKELLRFKDMENIFASSEGIFVKNHDMMKKLVDLIDLEEDDKIKVLMVHSTCQSAYTSLFVKSVTNHIRVVDAAIAALQRWVAESLNIIAPEKASQA